MIDQQSARSQRIVDLLVAHPLLFFDLRIRRDDFNPEHDPLTPGLRNSKHPAWLNA